MIQKLSKILIVVVVFLSACCPHRKLTSSTADSVRIETVVRTEFVKDTVYIDVPYEREVSVSPDSSHLETIFAVSDARILADGQLFHSLENKAQKHPVEVKTRIEYRDSIVYRDRAVKETVEIERKLTNWQKFQMNGFWIFVTIFVCVIGSKLYSMLKHGI